jgi:hypothetical protein
MNTRALVWALRRPHTKVVSIFVVCDEAAVVGYSIAGRVPTWEFNHMHTPYAAQDKALELTRDQEEAGAAIIMRPHVVPLTERTLDAIRDQTPGPLTTLSQVWLRDAH